MNVSNIRHPFTHVSIAGKYRKVTDTLNSCRTVEQQLNTLRWALRIGLSDAIFDIMGLYQWELIKQNLEGGTNNNVLNQEPAPKP